ncbi:MAG: hypothetical protein M3Y59_03925 [Myxococcota bacterium]|nr:hypothetical protein [Myxococcota bacterium]
MAKRPLLERFALGYFDKLSSGAELRRDTRVHILDAEERGQMRRIERSAIAKSALAGALSSVVSGAAEVYADQAFPAAAGAAFNTLLVYWGIVLGATLVASIFEIVYLYWDALKSVHRMAAAAGLPLRTVEGEGIAVAMARAALELPTPPNPVLGVDPRRESSRVRLALIALLYKGKIALTTFLLKVLIRRVVTRSAVRMAMYLPFLLPFLAVPVTALWNAVVTWYVVRESRIRALGPSAVQEAAAELLRDAPANGPIREAMIRAVASSIVRTQDLHPNLHELLLAVSAGVPPGSHLEVDSPQRFLELLPRLPVEAQRAVLRLLSVAAVIDGRLTSREKRLVAEACAVTGIEIPARDLEELRVAFVSGDGFHAEVLDILVPSAAPPAPLAQAS